MSEYKLLQGNCLQRMQEIPDNSIDLLLTDPPYNISVPNRFHTMNRQGIYFGDWDVNFNLTDWLVIAIQKIRKGGTGIVFTSWQNLSLLQKAIEENGCTVKNLIQWQKTNAMPRNRDRLYVNVTEFAIWFVKGDGWVFHRLKPTYETGIFCYPTIDNNERVHPTQKPIKLMLNLAEIHSDEGTTVLDPFMGSGTTGVACIYANRDFIGIELDNTYFNAAKSRIEEAASQSVLF